MEHSTVQQSIVNRTLFIFPYFLVNIYNIACTSSFPYTLYTKVVGQGDEGERVGGSMAPTLASWPNKITHVVTTTPWMAANELHSTAHSRPGATGQAGQAMA